MVYAGNTRCARGRSSENLMKLAVLNHRVASLQIFQAWLMPEIRGLLGVGALRTLMASAVLNPRAASLPKFLA